MKRYGKLVKIAGLTGLILLIGILCLLFLSVVAFGGLNFLLPVPKPTVTSGEFPIKVTCEFNGETYTVEDTILCEFDGFEVRGEAGKYRKWKSDLKSGTERLVLARIENGDVTDEIDVWYGFAAYYMGDYAERSREGCERMMKDQIYLGHTQWENGAQVKAEVLLQTEAWEKFHFKILQIDYAQPIKNSFYRFL